MDKVNILLVDDQPGKLLSYQAILDQLGENLVLAHNGREALQFLLQRECAVILLDVMMPEIDGYETAALIRQRPRLERTPILFVTAHSTSDLDQLKGYELGAVDYVFHPIVADILRAKVAVFVELYRSRRQLAVANEQLQCEIAERKRIEVQLLESTRLSAIGETMAALAHESRNALQQIQSSVEMLRRRIKGTAEFGLVGDVQRGHDRLHRLMEEVRGFAAPLKLACETKDLSQIWHEAWEDLEPLWKGREAKLQIECDQVDLRCWVDPHSLERVFRNVFENSLAACEDPVTIGVRCSDTQLNSQAAIRVQVVDSGLGLTPEQKLHLFEPFFTTKKGGAGLGMAIAKRVVEAHGGRIAANGDRSCGTIIDIVLPRGLT
jgi:signal transduction histidine kinase